MFTAEESWQHRAYHPFKGNSFLIPPPGNVVKKEKCTEAEVRQPERLCDSEEKGLKNARCCHTRAYCLLPLSCDEGSHPPQTHGCTHSSAKPSRAHRGVSITRHERRAHKCRAHTFSPLHFKQEKKEKLKSHVSG